MTKALGIAAIALAMSFALIASVALGVTLPSQANEHAVEAVANTPSGADVSGHPDAEMNGVPDKTPPVWLADEAPYGPPEWVADGGPPTWVITP